VKSTNCVVHDPATDSVLEIQIDCATEWSYVAAVPPNVTCRPEFAVAATPPEMKNPCPRIVAFAPPGAPVALQHNIIFRYHGPDSDDAGTVCAIDAPSVVPAALEVLIDGLIVNAPVAAVVINPPASSTYTLPGLESYAGISAYCIEFHMPTAVVAVFAANGSAIAGSRNPSS